MARQNDEELLAAMDPEGVATLHRALDRIAAATGLPSRSSVTSAEPGGTVIRGRPSG
ncbi:hypothetical protein NE236_15980 [Actinoallomurus purpureus]|uniref:hypothetical protein n=1 Tax=Actinoallomurus purpureus TaxID=478114 RepID=UPI00209221B8|nr:hypothetical protein [Actinoallomurus purpureus]MCO6006485.1 hypothetical protein [Actinoallomurus purpureus]